MSQIRLFSDWGEGYLFRNVELEFLETNRENKFSYLRDRTLFETILKKKYKQLATYVRDEYSSSLHNSLPDFLSTLKQSGDPFYRRFLNPHGDKRFCKFRMANSDVGDSKGMYLYLIGNRIMYVGITVDSFFKRINSGYGNISPKNCYLDGQATNCHLNSLINDSDHTSLSLWTCALEDVQELKKIERLFIEKLKPLWNLALKPVHESKGLYFTHCSESNNSDFKNSMDATTPDILYTSDRIKRFFVLVKEEDVSWAVFSDKYGFVFPDSLIKWYDLSPDDVSIDEVDGFVEDSIDELRKYEEIVYHAGKKPTHKTYQQLIDAMRSKGLTVLVEK